MIEERRQDQNCVFRRGDYKNKGHSPEMFALGSRPDDISVDRKLNRTEERCQDQSFLFLTEDYRSKDHNHKHTLWVRVPMKLVSIDVLNVHNTVKTNDLGFRDYIFFCQLKYFT
jgi:hypothetical protein